MKIAFIVTQFPSLSQTFILNQITGLMHRGHEVDIYAVQPENTPKMHADVTKYNLLHRTYYFRKLPSGKVERNREFRMLVAKYFYRKPKSLVKAWMLSRRGKSSFLKLLCMGFPFLDKHPYDIIHCHFGPNGVLGVILKSIGVIEGKIITSFYGYDLSSYLSKYGSDVYSDLFLKGDLFLPLGEIMKNQLIELGCNEQNIVIHRLGINLDKFHFSPREPMRNGKVQLLTISRLVEKKGVQYSIQALERVIKRYHCIEYRIVGDGPLKSSLEGLVKKLRLENYVTFLGWKEQQEIIELLKNTDILIVPSVTGKNGDQEGTPVVIMESFAQGLPVLSTQHSGIPELVQDGVSGFLVPEKDADALAEKLEYFIEHTGTWQKMGRAGREHVEKHYDIDKLNDKLAELYQLLLKGTLEAL